MDENRQNQPIENGVQGGEEKKRKLLEFREEEKKPLLTDAVKKEIREWLLSLVVAVVVVTLIRSFLFTIIRVDGPSMSDTLLDGDKLFVTIADMKIIGPQRFDVVICKYPQRRDHYVKRVIGLPGEVVELRANKLYVNGEYVEQHFDIGSSAPDFGPITVPADSYFVLGDNRGNSKDSRSAMVGPLERDMIKGHVRAVVFPFGNFRFIAD